MRTQSWRAMYLLGAAVGFVGVGGMLFDIVLSMMPGWGTGSVPTSVAGWLAQFAANPLLGVRNLDFLNITMSLVALPLYLAVFGALRREEPALAMLALLLVTVGTIIFASNNAALPMLELGRRYQVASTTAERAGIEAAAQALLARGAHGSFGAFLGFFLSELGTLLMGVAMLRGRAFGPVIGWFAVAGATVLAVYSVGITFAPNAEQLVMIIAIPGGLLMLAWNVMAGRSLLRLRHA